MVLAGTVRGRGAGHRTERVEPLSLVTCSAGLEKGHREAPLPPVVTCCSLSSLFMKVLLSTYDAPGKFLPSQTFQTVVPATLEAHRIPSLMALLTPWLPGFLTRPVTPQSPLSVPLP